MLSLPFVSQAERCSIAARWSALIEHSQTTATRQPMLPSAATVAASLSMFRPSLLSQKSALVLGKRKYGQPSWRCQKHPCTRMTAPHFGRTRSGFPGSFLPCNRKRKPRRQSSRRTISSGLVSLAWIRDINAERVPLSITSTISGISRLVCSTQVNWCNRHLCRPWWAWRGLQQFPAR